MIEPAHKPEFVTSEIAKTDFSKLVDREFAAAKAKDPNTTYASVLASVAKAHPELYQQHTYKVGGNPHAPSSILASANTDTAFKRLANLHFSAVSRIDPHASYGDSVAECMDAYPNLYANHVSQRSGISIPQPSLRLSERSKDSNEAHKVGGLDRYAFAEVAFPKLVNEEWAEMKKENKDSRYEGALRVAGSRFAELYADYQTAVGR